MFEIIIILLFGFLIYVEIKLQIIYLIKKKKKIMTFTHSLAQVAPYEFITHGSITSNTLTYNRQPQYTSYNGDLYTTIGVVPTFFDPNNDQLYYDYFGEKNINLVDANGFTNFNYIFDIYQLDENIPNLQDVVGYRYNQFEMYGINAYAAGKKVKNLGRYKVSPNPNTGLGSLNISRVIKAHNESSDIVNDIKDMIINSNNSYRNTISWYRPDTTNACKWKIEYGFEVNPGLTFSDTYFSIGSYTNPATGLVATYSLGFTFSYKHYLKYGDEIVIEMNDLGLNTDYNGLCYVVDVVNDYHIVVDKNFGVSTLNEGGSITYLLRANEIQTGNWWKWYGSQYEGLSYSTDNYSEGDTSGLGYMAGRQVTNFSINSTTQRSPNQLSNNFGQVGFVDSGDDASYFQKNPINDVSGLLINRNLFNNLRLNYTNTTAPSVNIDRFFLTNWDDATMGKKELNFYTWGNSNTTINFPDYTLGVLTHQNYWPAYWRNFTSPPTNFGEKLCTVPTFNYIRYIVKDSQGNVKATYERDLIDLIPTLSGSDLVIKDYEKFELVLSNTQLWLSLGIVPEQDDTFRVELVKKYIDGWTFSDFSSNISDDWNVIMDFDGLDYGQEGLEFWISAYPFHYQFTDFFNPFCSNRGVFKGPFGTKQNSLSTSSPFNPENYNKKLTSATVSKPDTLWPYDLLTGPINNRGYWFSEMEFVVNDVSCGFNVPIFTKSFNELFTDRDYSYGEFGGSTLPKGTYSIDYRVTTATQSSPDILSLFWNIGTFSKSLPVTIGIHRDVELYSDGGDLWFEALIDPPGQILIEPLKIRQKSDLVMAAKEFKCNIVCRGKNPYTTPFGKWDYGQKVELMFLNRLGSYERLYFDYDSKKTVNITRKNYTKSMIRDKWGLFNDNKHNNNIFSQRATEQYLINSDWISQNKLSFYEELITSPEVYIVQHYPIDRTQGSNTGSSLGVPYFNFIPVLVQDTSFQQKTYLRDKIFNLQLTIQLAFDVNLQNQ